MGVLVNKGDYNISALHVMHLHLMCSCPLGVYVVVHYKRNDLSSLYISTGCNLVWC